MRIRIDTLCPCAHQEEKVYCCTWLQFIESTDCVGGFASSLYVNVQILARARAFIRCEPIGYFDYFDHQDGTAQRGRDIDDVCAFFYDYLRRIQEKKIIKNYRLFFMLIKKEILFNQFLLYDLLLVSRSFEIYIYIYIVFFFKVKGVCKSRCVP